MQTLDRIYTSFSMLMPSAYRDHLRQELVYAGEKTSLNEWLGSWTILAMLTSIIIFLVPISIFRRIDYIFIVYALLCFFLIELVAYLMLYFKAEDRTKRIEEVLPDMLQLVSSNMKAGMTPYQALKRSARKEFGPLKDEIDFACAKALGTESFSNILLNISKRVKSDMLERSLDLFTTALKSGGKLSKLLEELGTDIRETKSLRDELVTSTKTYSLFVLFIILIGAPLLMSISIYFIEIIDKMQSSSTTTSAFNIGLLTGQLPITPAFITSVSIALLLLTSLFASMLVGVIKEGNIKSGMKSAPFYMIVSMIMFIIFRYAIESLFSKLI